MPQRYGEGEIFLAREVLLGNRMLYWCILCGRPRKKNYCPVAARTKKNRHNTVLRSTISPNDQLASYLYQGDQRGADNDANVTNSHNAGVEE